MHPALGMHSDLLVSAICTIWVALMQSLCEQNIITPRLRQVAAPSLIVSNHCLACRSSRELRRLSLITRLGSCGFRQGWVVPKIEIVGESDIYVKTGSTVNLKCVITQSLEEPAYIFWYHDNERVLNYDKTAKDIRMDRVGPDTTVGTLVIYNGQRQDSGNYTCSPSNLDSASVLLHVLNGEHPAAMQRGKNSASPIPGRWWSHLSAGLGLSACVQPRNVAIAVIVLGFAGHLVAWTGS
uniref:Ig-like domain-containing protein n=1 Tax=Timema genevievae TaxID=629358 RepID=A0A7R9JNC9_TIMGE|nr:unnamed protein product [Timema genevievae]